MGEEPQFVRIRLEALSLREVPSKSEAMKETVIYGGR